MTSRKMESLDLKIIGFPRIIWAFDVNNSLHQEQSRSRTQLQLRVLKMQIEI